MYLVQKYYSFLTVFFCLGILYKVPSAIDPSVPTLVKVYRSISSIHWWRFVMHDLSALDFLALQKADGTFQTTLEADKTMGHFTVLILSSLNLVQCRFVLFATSECMDAH